MAGCIYCGKTGKRLCDSCAERLKKRNLQFLFPLSSSDVSAISAICKPKPEPQKAVWTASSDTANKNTAARTYTPVKQQPKVTASKPTSGGSVVSPRNNDVQYEGPYRLLKDPIGNYTGKGKYTFTDGEIYKGDFVDGKRTGRGILTLSGDIYVGDFVDGERTGKGMCKYINGDVYKGDFVDGKRTGRGKLEFSNGDIYEGDFVDGKCVGKGKYIWASGNVYEGNYLDNNFNGKGKLIWKNGDIYEGDFVNDERTGKGKYTWTSGEIYEGDFVDGKGTGRGKFTSSNGDIYEGDFVDGKLTGKGKFISSNGNIYEGDFVDGKLTGQGVCRFANGEDYIGAFIDGKRQGYGTQYGINGVDIHRGKWENDKFVEKNESDYNIDRLIFQTPENNQTASDTGTHANNSHTSSISSAGSASTGRSNANNTSRDNSEDTVSDISALVVLFAGMGIMLGLILAAIFTPWHIGQWFASSLVSIAVLVGFIISSSLGSHFYFHNVFFLLFSSANIVLRFYFQAAYKPFFILVSIALFISFVYLMFCEFDFDEKRRGRITLLIESVSLLIQFLFLFAGEDWFYDTLFPFFEQIFTYVEDLL